jgi:hypothetical protein
MQVGIEAARQAEAQQGRGTGLRQRQSRATRPLRRAAADRDHTTEPARDPRLGPQANDDTER